MVAEGDGIGARCVRKSSDVGGSPPKTGISGEGASPPKTGIYGEGTSPPKIASWAFIHFVLGVCNFARAKAIAHLDDKHVVFGELQTGISVLDRMKSVELLEPRSEGKPAPHQRVK